MLMLWRHVENMGRSHFVLMMNRISTYLQRHNVGRPYIPT